MTKRHVRTRIAGLMFSAALVSSLAIVPSTLALPNPANAAGMLRASPPCRTSQLSLGFGGALSPASGEDAVVLTLTNTSRKFCQLLGYPTVKFDTSTGRVLPFAYGRVSQYFARLVPRLVGLRPGERGYFEVAKYRCDLGDLMKASVIRVALAVSPGASLARKLPPTSGDGVTYCKGGVKDPGQYVGVSTVVATQRQLVPYAKPV